MIKYHHLDQYKKSQEEQLQCIISKTEATFFVAWLLFWIEKLLLVYLMFGKEAYLYATKSQNNAPLTSSGGTLLVIGRFASRTIYLLLIWIENDRIITSVSFCTFGFRASLCMSVCNTNRTPNHVAKIRKYFRFYFYFKIIILISNSC